MPGRSNPRSKLTDDDVVEIRRLAGFRVKYDTLAYQFGVAPTTIAQVVQRKTWRHVP